MKNTPAKKGKGRAVNTAQTKRPPQKRSGANSRRKLRSAQVAAPGSRAAVAAMIRERDRKARLSAPVERTSPERRERFRQLLKLTGGNDAESQRQRVLHALEGGTLTTHEARSYLDVLSPAARVRELRLAGYDIETVWVSQVTGAGTSHRIAKYVLTRRAR